MIDATQKQQLLAEADRIAQRLSREDRGVRNELGKALAVLREQRSVKRTMQILSYVAGDRTAHASGNTRAYVDAVARVVDDTARRFQGPDREADLEQVLYCLGWAFRMLRARPPTGGRSPHQRGGRGGDGRYGGGHGGRR